MARNPFQKTPDMPPATVDSGHPETTMPERQSTDWGDLTPAAIQSIQRAIADGVARGMSDGIRAAVADQELMRSAVDHLFVAAREEVATQSGRWLWTGLGGLLARLAWWLLIAAGILTVGGGWAGVAAFFKAGAAKP